MYKKQALDRSSPRAPASFLVVLWLLLLLCAVVALAQTSQRTVPSAQKKCPPAFATEEAEKDFAAATAKYLRRFRSLVSSRGVTRDDALAEPPDSRFLKQLTAVLSQRFEEGTAVLFYAADESFFRAWLIDRDGIQAFHRAGQSFVEMEAAVKGFRESLDVEDLAVRRLPPRLRPVKRAVAASALNPKTLLASRLTALTNLLLPSDLSCALESVRHLIVVPIYDLGTVPFAALRPFGPSSNLIDRMSVTIAPSLADIVRQSNSAWSADFSRPLLVGNPYLAPSAGWESLDNAEQEARFVGQMFKAKPLVGREATRGEIVRQAAAADFLYFATHGAADIANPLEGGFLVFSGPNGTEGLWTAREIQETRLRARLAVLSACQTGLGKTHDAGVVGLARAFQLAGVPRVVMSLWSVYDDATADLMRAFARNLRAHPPAEALRLAMLEVRARRPDPAEWASFVIFGTPQ
jgi:CHAT domain-containing protein